METVVSIVCVVVPGLLPLVLVAVYTLGRRDGYNAACADLSIAKVQAQDT